ncbi:PDGF- and VEGF-related factor 1 [Rhodnius prolixus]|uniref:PDGF- and VEGF-related factor 1 n=1 Tax=Rhodnius prolixus TaxID=13249 RepID=UPI003D18B7B2
MEPLHMSTTLFFVLSAYHFLLINSASTVTNFINEEALHLVTEAGSGETKEVVTEVAQAARCMPEKQVVRLGAPADPNLHYSPSCTRIERCGGCCTQDALLSCQPVEKVTVYFLVNVIERNYSAGSYPQSRKDVVRVEKHSKCKCGCIVKKEHCNPLQEYVEENCSCVCRNRDERAKCKDDPLNKSWDPHSCTCVCREVKQCNTGSRFNKHTCSCEPQRSRPNFFSYSSLSYPQQTSVK